MPLEIGKSSSGFCFESFHHSGCISLSAVSFLTLVSTVTTQHDFCLILFASLLGDVPLTGRFKQFLSVSEN